jgi:hypothetical protein
MRTRTAIYSLAASVSAFGLTLLSGPWVPRFSFDPLNYWFAAVAAFAVPLTIGLVGYSTTGFWRRGSMFAVAVLVALPMLPYGLFAMLESGSMKDGEHLSLRFLSETSAGSIKYRLYRTDCGATCAYGLELRKEFDVLGVVKFVSSVWSSYREEPATLRLSPDGRVQVIRGEYVMHTVSDDA